MKWHIMLVGSCLLCLILVMPLAAQSSNAEAKEVITKMTAAMTLLAEQVEEMSSPQDFARACNQYAETVEAYGKKMYAIIQAHPEWGENPPTEMEATLAGYGEALTVYDPALTTLTRYANEHQDNEAVQRAMQRLNTAVYEMYR
ncbi:MAG: hypothetical protein ACLFNX_11370 [Spirochaetaceae bacterium]